MDQQIETAERLWNMVIAFGVTYGFQFVGALIILVLGGLLARWIGGLIERLCARRGLDVTVSRFFASMARATVMVFVVIVALSKFGVSIAPFVAALGAIAFGSSLALAGPLSNYGAGLAIIVARPFAVGNTITVNDLSGVVEDIRLAATYLQTEDGETVIIPNKEIVGQVLVNSFANRVVHLTVAVGYDDDPDRAISVIAEALSRSGEVVSDPAPQIGIAAFGDSAIEVAVRYWVPTRRYFQTQFQANNAIWRALREAGVSIPYPRQELRIVDRAGATPPAGN